MTLTTKKIIETAFEMLPDKPIKFCETGLSNEAYHANHLYVSRSALMDFDKSPYTYWAKHLNPERPIRESTPQMILGSAFHTLILEPHLFDELYAVKPEKVLLKDVGREAYDDFKRKEEELLLTKKTVLSNEMYETLLAMQKTLLFNRNATMLIEGGRIENSFFWQDEESGVLLKCRPDILHENMIVDLKTCADASMRGFQNAMVSNGYHIQGAMIRDAVQMVEDRTINNVINICIETKYPYNTAIYIIDELALAAGWEKYKKLCLDLKMAREENSFIDFGIQTVGLPRWAI